MHRELLGLKRFDGIIGDHINRDHLDNRRTNLRKIQKHLSSQNQPSHAGSSSSYRGVTWNKRQRKWQASVKASGRYFYLGLFTDESEAARVAQRARLRLLPGAVD
jgi:hypothetical protein